MGCVVILILQIRLITPKAIKTLRRGDFFLEAGTKLHYVPITNQLKPEDTVQ